MKIIFVRHGQTGENTVHRHQPDHTPLSHVGRKQAVVAGEQLVSLDVTHVFSSPLIRALQTASLIANECDLIPSIDHDLKELQRPDAMTGYSHFSFKSLLFYKFWFLGFTRTGESYRQMRSRIVSARSTLECLSNDAVVVVVSHTVFINLFIAHLDRTSALWPWQSALVFLRVIRMKNTGMIELTYAGGKWQRTNDLNLS